MKFLGSSTAMESEVCTHYMEKVDRKSKVSIHTLHFRWTLQDLQCT